MLRFAKSLVFTGLFIAPQLSFAGRDSAFLETTELKCVSDGVEIATGQGSSPGLTPSPKFLALLGFAVQRNYKGVNAARGGSERELYLQRVIEIIQANGFCLAEKLDGGGVPTAQDGYGGISGESKTPDKLKVAVMGFGSRDINTKEGDTQNNLTTKEFNKIVKYFGFKNEGEINALFRDSSWSGLTPAQRQQKFKNSADYGNYSDGLKECVSQMKKMHSTAIFNHNGTRSSQGIKFCETLAKSCNLESSSFCSVSKLDYIKGEGPAPASAPPKGTSIFDKLNGNTGAK